MSRRKQRKPGHRTTAARKLRRSVVAMMVVAGGMAAALPAARAADSAAPGDQKGVVCNTRRKDRTGLLCDLIKKTPSAAVNAAAVNNSQTPATSDGPAAKGFQCDGARKTAA
jgi:hypothetical protein